jgi:hypothetical protein
MDGKNQDNSNDQNNTSVFSDDASSLPPVNESQASVDPNVKP